ncbi:MAG TPA: ethanolamine utilization protein EutJ [Steroidobacteraceae bacterium]|nr:ethanolamine utilization protein EutJ [Steroidobacteraceae bacterium]
MLAHAANACAMAPAPGVRDFLEEAARRFQAPRAHDGDLLFGVDLGTATIVLTAIDRGGSPVYWTASPSGAVRDGVVVDFGGAVETLRKLMGEAEAMLGVRVASAGTAFPPGIPEVEARACRYVLEKAQINCRRLVDEISAAQALLGIRDGAIVDVGGGSTGVGVWEDGRLVTLDDAPGGGHHLDLILAGALRIPVEEAERRKREADHASILRPGIERIASSIKRQIGSRTVPVVHLVGGAVRVSGAATVIAAFIGIPTVAYPHSDLVTPFGIAKS